MSDTLSTIGSIASIFSVLITILGIPVLKRKLNDNKTKSMLFISSILLIGFILPIVLLFLSVRDFEGVYFWITFITSILLLLSFFVLMIILFVIKKWTKDIDK